MGLLELLGYVLLVCVIGSLFIYLRRAFAPNMLPQVDIAVMILCLVIVILLMLQAIGIFPRDPKVPQIR